MLRKLINKKQEGFTIIEVMIVLAIAGLILVVVLIAIPQLQRNQRNQSRQSVASRIATEINNYAGNNNGKIPDPVLASGASNFAAPYQALGFFARYLGCSGGTPPGGGGAPTGSSATCTSNINDARTGTPVGTGMEGTNAITTKTPIAAGGAPDTQAGSIAYGTGLVCDGETPVVGATRNFVFMMRLEGGAVYCLDNK